MGGATAVAAAVPALPDADLVPRPPQRWAARAASDMPEPDLAALLLNRAAFGARPGEVEALRAMGQPYDWIEAQLDYATIDDSEVEDELVANLPTLSMKPHQMFLGNNIRYQARSEISLATLYRMVFSRRQLYQVMVEFWTDHFSIDINTDQCDIFKPIDDRDVIRKHALGNFKDLLTASAMSPAMLNYLNNDVSTKIQPNENYAREIMELHTLGVAINGVPYTEDDIKEVAKCFTGWSWNRRQGPQLGTFEYRSDDHENGVKTVLGEFIVPGQGIGDGRQVVDILCNHPATARYLATKLVRRFVTDDPARQTPELVEQVAAAFQRSKGDIKEMVRTILTSEAFAQSFARYGGRLSRPMDLMARSLRAAGVGPQHFPTLLPQRNPNGGTTGPANLVYERTYRALQMMGHLPFYWPTPDGYPDIKDAWASSVNMLVRWNYGLALCGVGGGTFGVQLIPNFRPRDQMPTGVTTAGGAVDFWTDRLLHRPVLAGDRDLLVEYLTDGGPASTPINNAIGNRLPEMIAMILDSPYFQWR